MTRILSTLQNPHESPRPQPKEPTPSERAWAAIHKALEEWNKQTGRGEVIMAARREVSR